MVRWSTQGVDFNTNYTSKLEILLLELDKTESATFNFHVDGFQGNHIYNIIPERDILLELKIYPCFSEDISRVNGGTYKGCTAPIKIFKSFISTHNLIGLKTRYFGMKTYGRANMLWMTHQAHATY